MIRLNVNDELVVVSSVAAQTIAADSTTVNGASVDMRDYPGYRVMAACSVGTYTDGAYTFSVQDSADDSSFAALTPADGSHAAIGAANTDEAVGYVPVSGRPYLRVSVVSDANVTTGAQLAGYLVLVPPYGSI
jgi:hypothetical protein